ncbi:MAG: MFS transporter [Treponema sp.]|jgi:GPH family glycoside/pentoside/hexuronide:cation symporter|nr:MFS transporter [Treponema sp.]
MAENENVQVKGPKPISKTTRFWYGLGDCGFTIMSNVEAFFFNFFLTNIAMFAAEIAATISLITSIVDTVLSWIYGGIINAAKPGKWGRYRSWLITVPWIVPLLFSIEFLKIGEGFLAYAVIVLAYSVTHIVWNIPYVANATLVSACGGTPEGRAMLASSRATWNQLAGVAFSYIGPPLALVFAGIVGQNYQYAVLAFVLGLVMVFGYWVNFKVTEGYEAVESPEDIAKKQSKTRASAKDMVKALFQNSHLCFLILGDFPKWIIKFVTAGAAIYYFRYVAQNAGLLPQYLLISNIAAALGGFVAAFLAKKFTSRTTVVITYIVMAAACILSFLMYQSIWLVIILMSFVQMGYGVCYACSSALYADAAVYSQWKLGADSRGWIMGLQNVPLKAAVIARALILNGALMLAGFNAGIDPAQATESLKKGVTAAFALVPGFFLCAGIFLILFGFRLTQKDIVKYQEEINARTGN